MDVNQSQVRGHIGLGASSARRAVVATVIGNGLEWFDFTVYSYFSVILAKVFFPTGNDFTSLLLTVATFGVGFVMRPVGGIVIGIYTDRKGRKAGMTLTIMLMAVGTALIGFTPSYISIGFWAPLSIVVARLTQGFAAGGEMGAATAFLTEHAPPGKKAFFSSWILSSIGLAVLLGAMAGTYVTTALDAAAVTAWGWRIPFVLGLLIGPVGFYFRSRIEEPAGYAEDRLLSPTLPLKAALTTHARETFACFAMVILWTVAIYVLLFYMPTYSARVLHLPQRQGFIAGMVGGAAMMFIAPLAGWLADRIGARIIMAPSACLIMLLAWPMFTYINVSPGLFSLLVFQAVFGMLTGMYTGPILAAFAHQFPGSVLATAISIAYNCGVTIFGGFASFFVTWLIASTNTPVAPAYYVMTAAALSLIGLWLMRKAG